MHQACAGKYSHINMQIYKYKVTFFTKHGASHFSEKFMSIRKENRTEKDSKLLNLFSWAYKGVHATITHSWD